MHTPSLRTSASWVGHLVMWCALFALIGLLLAAVAIPRLGGGTTYTIKTGSMTPGLPPGTLIVVRPVDPADIGIGAVITYQLHSGDPTVVTHRVVGVTRIDGEPAFQTRGDANNAPDSEWVRGVQVKGKFWYRVPYAGRIGTFVTGSSRGIATYVLAGALFAYAAAMYVGAGRARRRHDDPNPRSA